MKNQKNNAYRNGRNDAPKKFNPPSKGVSKGLAAATGSVILGAIGGPVGYAIGAIGGYLFGDNSDEMKRKKRDHIKYKVGHKHEHAKRRRNSR